MSYHILEVKKIDKNGHVLSWDFFVVDSEGNKIRGPFDNIATAIEVLEELEDTDEPPPPSEGSSPTPRF